MVNLTSTEVSRRRRVRERLGMPLPGPGRRRCHDPEGDRRLSAAVAFYELLGRDVDRYTPADDEAARMVMSHSDGYVVVVDGRVAVHARTPAQVLAATKAADRFARVVAVDECWAR